MALRFLLVALLAGCPWVGPDELAERLGEDDAPVRDTGHDGVDFDGDGWVDVADGGRDCDDHNNGVHPHAPETCDGVDEDCDGTVDDDAIDASTWYPDGDGDGFGDTAGERLSCEAPDGYAAWGGDCDDADPAYHPSAPETDCAAAHDYNCDGYIGSTDHDGDGLAACAECDDGDATVYPGAPEVCDARDDDCDGTVDEADAVDADAWYADADHDHYGDDATSVTACERPSGYVPDAGDCDDADAAVNPEGLERCDGPGDEDCDGTVDEADASGCTAWYYDGDGDGHGANTSACYCAATDAWRATSADDCDDGQALAWTGAAETCDGVDNDCDGAVDEDVSGLGTYYRDADGDGYGNPAAATTSCGAPAGYVADATDCDDGNAGVHPGGGEVCDGVDDDCDGLTDPAGSSGCATWYQDGDADGYGTSAGSCQCAAGGGYTASSASDCDDSNAAINPGATEYCNGVDDNCDGDTDPSYSYDCEGGWFRDYDGDGYGGDWEICACPGGWGSWNTQDSSDCDDSNGSMYPGATEYCDGEDDDCDGTADDGCI